MATLEIKNLHVEVKDEEKKAYKKILKGVNLTMHTGEIHALWDQMVQVNQLYLKQSWAILNIVLLKVKFC